MNRVVATLNVNGQSYQAAVRPYEILLDTIREQLNLIGTKRGCDMGTCGCCTVIMGGKPRLSCLTLTLEAEDEPITTVEGLSHGDQLHPVQEAFVGWGGSQCGFCTPGFIMTSVCLLAANPEPSDEQIKEAIAGNLCRCTGYIKIVDAIRDAARKTLERRQQSFVSETPPSPTPSLLSSPARLSGSLTAEAPTAGRGPDLSRSKPVI